MAERSLQRSAQEDLQRVSLELEAARENWERESTSLVTLAKVWPVGGATGQSPCHSISLHTAGEGGGD